MPTYAAPEGVQATPVVIQQGGIEAILLAPAQTSTPTDPGGGVRPPYGQTWPR